MTNTCFQENWVQDLVVEPIDRTFLPAFLYLHLKEINKILPTISLRELFLHIETVSIKYSGTVHLNSNFSS